MRDPRTLCVPSTPQSGGRQAFHAERGTRTQQPCPPWERHEWILYSYITLHIAYRYYENIMYLFA